MNKLLKLILIATFFNGLSWIILVPVWQYSDEQAHFAQVQNIAEIGFVPTKANDTSLEIAFSEQILKTERDIFGNNKFTYNPDFNINYSKNSDLGPKELEIINLPVNSRSKLVKKESTNNPPLYYFLGSQFYKVIYDGSLFDRVYAVRIFSLTIFLFTVFVAFKIGEEIFEKDKEHSLLNKFFPISLACLVAFKPMHVFASTGILPDPLTNLLFSIVLLISVKIIKNGVNVNYLVVLLPVIIAGSFTRQQFLISIPIVIIPILYQIFISGKKSFKSIYFLTVSIAIFYILSFFIPQLIYIRGAFPEVGTPDYKLLFSNKFIDFSIWTIKNSIAQTLPWYWGVYRWLSFTVPHVNYQVINRIILLSILGIIFKLLSTLKSKKLKKSDIILIYMIISSAFYFVVFVIWDYYFFLDKGFSFGIQGRYFFPMIIFHLAIILLGLQKVFEVILKKYYLYGFFSIAFLIIVFNNISLFSLAASYYNTSSIHQFTIQASQYKPFLLKGNIIIAVIFTGVITQAMFLSELLKKITKSKQNY